jgi:hypothetical protein
LRFAAAAEFEPCERAYPFACGGLLGSSPCCVLV